MQCERCLAAPATVHLTHVVHGTLRKADFCEACARTEGAVDPSTGALVDLLIGRSGHPAHPLLNAEGDLTCRRCGFTEVDFKKTGRLGCAACYEYLADALAPTLKQTQKRVAHRGKFPRAATHAAVLTPLLSGLQHELQEAVRLGLASKAALLQDQIRRLEAVQRRTEA